MTTTPLYTQREVATLWGVSTKTVTRWADAGRIPCIKTPTGRRRYPRDEIDAMLDTEPTLRHIDPPGHHATTEDT